MFTLSTRMSFGHGKQISIYKIVYKSTMKENIITQYFEKVEKKRIIVIFAALQRKKEPLLP